MYELESDSLLFSKYIQRITEHDCKSFSCRNQSVLFLHVPSFVYSRPVKEVPNISRRSTLIICLRMFYRLSIFLQLLCVSETLVLLYIFHVSCVLSSVLRYVNTTLLFLFSCKKLHTQTVTYFATFEPLSSNNFPLNQLQKKPYLYIALEPTCRLSIPLFCPTSLDSDIVIIVKLVSTLKKNKRISPLQQL